MTDGSRHVFVSGATGYLGQRLVRELVLRGHRVRALARPTSTHKLPAGVQCIAGDALDARSFQAEIAPCDTFVQLVGVAHPSPRKAREFFSVDLASARAGARAAAFAGVRHFVYVSVARPAPVMKAYQDARAQAEAAIENAGLRATILRPWYVLGPGHRWPYLLFPIYWLAELLPWTRAGARRLGLVTLEQMTRALVLSIESPMLAGRVLEVPEIRSLKMRSS